MTSGTDCRRRVDFVRVSDLGRGERKVVASCDVDAMIDVP